jgi:predicted phage terminase large subunit-like protein
MKLKKASLSFPGFMEYYYPDFEFADFQDELQEVLDLLEKDALVSKGGNPVRNLLINMPPRHSKSFHSTINLPAYALMRKPTREIMVSAYNAELASTFGRGTREIVTDSRATRPFSKFELSKESRAVDFWKTQNGGAYYAVGLNGTTTGRGANMLLVDDPYKSREEADSATKRRQIWDFYIAGLLSRRQPDRDGQPALQIVTHTRWHPDDMAGRIMDSPEFKRGEWHHLNFEALTQTAKKKWVSRANLPKTDPRYIPFVSNEDAGAEVDEKDAARPFIETGASRRTAGRVLPMDGTGEFTALWPKRFDVTWLLQQRSVLGEREFTALYQQSPYIVGGNILKENWLRRYDTLALPEMHAIAVTVDTAFKAGNRNDYSVFSIGGITSMGDIYLMKVIREKLEFPDLKRKAIAVNAAYRGQGLRGFWVEDKASGQSLIQELRNDSGVAIIPWKTGTDDKVQRASSITPLMEAGRVYVPNEAEWLDEWLSEIVSFPSVKHDDQVDSFVMLVDVLSRMVVSGMKDFSAPLGMLVGPAGQVKLESDLLFSTAPLQADPNGWMGGGGFGKALGGAWTGWGE